MLLYFDNYGKFLCEENPGTLKEIHHYLYQMAAGKSNRTFYYAYVLICGWEQQEIYREAMRKYMKTYGGIA